MSKILHVTVADKIATYLQRDGEIVCGNSDYEIHFAFDSEWNAHTTKTARFIWGGKHLDVVFTGTVCNVPVIMDADEVKVGVFAGELTTTTPASIGCKESILCGGEEAHGGVALMPDVVNIVQTTGSSETDVMSQKAVTDELYEKNEVDLSQYDFSQGTLASGVFEEGNLYRCATRDFIPIQEFSRLFVNVVAGYQFEVDFYDSNKTYLTDTGWLVTSKEIDIPENAVYIQVIIALDHPGEITPDVAIDKAKFVFYINTLEKLGASQKEVADAIKFPFEKYSVPTVYLDGNISAMTKDNAVTLRYRYGDRSGSCTVKWQGTSSIAYPKKNYTVKFDAAFEAAEGWGVHDKYCLKADWIDFSHCRNVVAAKLWGDVVKSRAASSITTKLSALPNAGAVDGFPCFVVINGEWMGVYNFNIPKDGWMLGMGSGNKEAILCADNPNGEGCFWYSLAVIGTDYDLEYASDEANAGWVQTSLDNLISTYRAGNYARILEVLEFTSAIDYFIFAALIYHGDGIGKNHILATYDGTKWFFSAYDMDGTFGLYVSGDGFSTASLTPWTGPINSFQRLASVHIAFNTIYNYRQAELIARYKELRAGALSEANVAKVFYNHACQIPMTAKIAELEKWISIPSADANNVAQAVAFYTERARLLDGEIAEIEASLS